MEKFEQLKQMLESMESDVDKFYNKGVSSAGGRVRKELNNIRKLCADLRKEIQEIRNSKSSKKSESPVE